MVEPQLQWQVKPVAEIPEFYISIVRKYLPEFTCKYLAQLLWQREIKDEEKLAGFLNPQLYKPANPFDFGEEMHWAVERIIIARNEGQKVAIWGDFDADGITATSVLWDGLGEFFRQDSQLSYYIPNRLIESHGLNLQGIDALARQNVRLIITCDTGSTNIEEIEYANKLGIDIIVTDHHTLPVERPPVVAIANPRYLPPDHPMYNLSGVAVAYKLIEALYLTLPEIPQRPLEDLLDLVAIGLIADLVELTGDCRYLAQLGIQKLGKQLKNRTRPGVAKLLELCKTNGDRPTDISFGIGPRINAVSRIIGDASFCVELLTSRDIDRCNRLALETELANTRRKALQKNVAKDVVEKLTALDLSTTSIIILSDPAWQTGVLGLVAGEIAQKYGRPTILLSTESQQEDTDNFQLARGSARSVNKIDLYELVRGQAHLLHRFGGHPFAAGLSLPVENIPLFADAINQQLGQQVARDGRLTSPIVEADLRVTVSELGKDLFKELKLLEPCGMGNPVPKLLIENCWFDNCRHQNQKDLRGKLVRYIKTDFQIWDDSQEQGFPGVWWGHYKDEIPEGRCDAMVELDFNSFKKRYEVRSIGVRPRVEDVSVTVGNNINWILDKRNIDFPLGRRKLLKQEKEEAEPDYQQVISVRECPQSWDDLRVWFRRAVYKKEKLALAYSLPSFIPPIEVLQKSIGIAKFLSRTGQSVTRSQLCQKLAIGETSLKLGFIVLKQLGFNVKYRDRAFYICQNGLSSGGIGAADESQVSRSASGEVSQAGFPTSEVSSSAIAEFLAAVREEQFRRQYFCEVPLATIEAIAARTVWEEDDQSSVIF